MDLSAVFARAIPSPLQLEMLEVFDSRERAQAFIGHVPQPQRDCLEIHAWILNRGRQ